MIEVQSISKKLDSFSIKNVNLKVNKGEYLVILGPTGAGKTVLLEIIAGIVKPDNGIVLNDNKDITHVVQNKRNIGILYQDYLLFPHFTVKQNIEYGLKKLKLLKSEREKKTDEIAKLFRINHLLHRYPENLSGGEKQRTALARTLVLNNDVVLFDEPFAALDIITKEKLLNEVRSIYKEYGLTVIHVAHDFEEAISLADKIAIMNNGEILQVGKPSEVFRKPCSNFIAQFVGARNIFEGNFYDKSGENIFSVNGVDIAVTGNHKHKKYMVLRPEDIILSLDKVSSSARNMFCGKVLDILHKQYVYEITIDIGIPIVSFITKKSFENLDIKIGKKIWASFKAMEVHLF